MADLTLTAGAVSGSRQFTNSKLEDLVPDFLRSQDQDPDDTNKFPDEDTKLQFVVDWMAREVKDNTNRYRHRVALRDVSYVEADI
jgi:hypothetical protein